MHLLAFAFAIAALICLLVVIVADWRHKPFAQRTMEQVLPKIPDELKPSDPTSSAARQNLRQACQQSGRYHLAHHSLGKRLLDSDHEAP